MFGNLMAEKYDRRYSDRQLFNRLGRYFGAHRAMVIKMALAVLGITAVSLAEPLLMSYGLSQATRSPTTAAIFGLAAILFMGAMLNFLMSRLRRRTGARLIGAIVGELRDEAFRATIRHDMAFFDEFQSGKVISRITNDTQEIASTTSLLFDLISQFTTLLVLIVVLLRISPPLTLTLLVMAPFIALFGYSFRQVARKVTRGGFRVTADVNAAIQETVAGMRVAKSFRQ